MTRSLLAVALLLAPPALAGSERGLGAHEHGQSRLDIAVEGSVVAMELRAPGADIVGFEYAPASEEEEAAVAAAKETLGQPLSLFVLPDAAGCTATDARVALVFEDADGDEHAHGEEHGDEHAHGEEHGDEHAHGEAHGDEHAHSEEHGDEHAHGEEHGDEHAHGEAHGDEHAHGEAHGGHSEFRATYAIACADPAAIDSLRFAFFDAFPNAREVAVQMISEAGSAGYEVERDDPVLDLGGLL